jgi:hypothetical protein
MKIKTKMRGGNQVDAPDSGDGGSGGGGGRGCG